MSNQQRKAAVFSNSDNGFNSYDGVFSSMSVRFFNNTAVLDLAPINPDMTGKTPKAGDKVYDYESKRSLYFTSHTAYSLLVAIKKLKESLETDEPLTSVKVEIGFGENKKSVEIFAPGKAITVQKKTYANENNFLLKCIIIDDEEKSTAYHILQNSTIELKVGKDVYEEEFYSDLEMLELFLLQVINLGTGAYRHGAALAGGVASSGTNKPKSKFFTVDADDEDDDETSDDDDEETEKPTSKTKRNTASKKSSLKELANEFTEDD